MTEAIYIFPHNPNFKGTQKSHYKPSNQSQVHIPSPSFIQLTHTMSVSPILKQPKQPGTALKPQSLLELFKLVGPMTSTLPCLAFLVEIPIRLYLFYLYFLLFICFLTDSGASHVALHSVACAPPPLRKCKK